MKKLASSTHDKTDGATYGKIDGVTKQSTFAAWLTIKQMVRLEKSYWRLALRKVLSGAIHKKNWLRYLEETDSLLTKVEAKKNILAS